jgi:hypothetical protein
MLGDCVRASCATVALLALTRAVACGHAPAISAEHAFYVEHESYRQMAKVQDLPPALRSALATAPGVAGGILADPDERIRAALTFGSSNLPAARLREAWCAPNHCIVQYEVAAIVGRYRLVLLGVATNQATIEWAETIDTPRHGLDELKAAVLADAGG